MALAAGLHFLLELWSCFWSVCYFGEGVPRCEHSRGRWRCGIVESLYLFICMCFMLELFVVVRISGLLFEVRVDSVVFRTFETA